MAVRIAGVPDPISAHHPRHGHAWAVGLREAGIKAAVATERPDRSDEDWRHTDVSRIPFEGLVPASAEPTGAEVLAAAEAAGERCALLVTWPGGARTVEAGPDGVVLEPLASLEDGTGVGEIVPVDADIFCALNAAHWDGGAAVRVAEGACPDGAIVVVHWCAEAGAAAFPRTCVDVGRLAEVTVVEVWAGPAAADGSLVAAVVEVSVGDGASLRHAAVQQLDDASTFVGTVAARVGGDARISATAAALGARTHRLRTGTELAGDGASAEAFGVYVADDERHVDFRATQHHIGARCTSDLLYRGAAWDSASTVFSGLIRIEPSAAHSDAHQASHYLLLSEHARAANIPNLEILNHDVKCSHASSGGPPDEDQLYYLAARGIAPAVAERLVVDGFFADVAARIPVAAVGEHVVAEVGRRLAVLRGQA